MSTRVKQALIVAAGTVVAVVMVFLGLWQMQVFVDQGNRTVADRAAQAAVPLSEHLGSDQEVGDVYGKQVTVSGVYHPDEQLLIPTGDAYRVLTAFEIADGRLLPVVRGLVTDPDDVPDAPTGVQTQTGLFLPGEGNVTDDQGLPVASQEGQLPSVRMPSVAQLWPSQLVPGFVTLSETDAGAQGLAVAPVELPSGEGSARNSGYALQWWVFAAFALGMSIKFAHSVGVRDRRAREAVALAPHRKETSA